MNSLRSVEEIGDNLRVILRMDTDLPIEDGAVEDDSRLRKSVPTIRLLLNRNNKIAIIGHRGRPEGRDPELSLRPVYAELMGLLELNGENTIESVFVDDITNREMVEMAWSNNQIIFLENLRFWSGEEKNEGEFLDGLVNGADAYVDDAFAVAHRKHASMMLHRRMEAYYGLAFVEEAEKIGKVLDNPERPLIVLLGGAKEDKLKYLSEISGKTDKILIGGKLPQFLKSSFQFSNNTRVVWGKLTEDGLDINEETINRFKEMIAGAKTIIWAGAMGWFEDEAHRRGTEEIARAVAGVNGYKIIAGGDTGAAVEGLGLKDKIDFVCSGGGVMLQYIAQGSLPAWE